MSKHTTPLPHADQTGPEAAEPAPRASRFDERGIALQTIIIMVVLLAIAGSVAAVLLNRAGQETDRLEGETDRWSEVTNETGCDIAGGRWLDNLTDAGAETPSDDDGDENCYPPAS